MYFVFERKSQFVEVVLGREEKNFVRIVLSNHWLIERLYFYRLNSLGCRGARYFFRDRTREREREKEKERERERERQSQRKKANESEQKTISMAESGFGS